MVTLWPRAAKVFAAARPATPAPIMQTVFCLTIDFPPRLHSAERIVPAAIANVPRSRLLAEPRPQQMGGIRNPDARRWRLQAENSLRAPPRGGLFRPHP